MADEQRLQWIGKLEYLFAVMGYTIGVGNLWRFPYRCYIHGGGVFLLPYLLTVILCTSPMLFMETLLGQFSSLGPITVWKFCPLFKGVGWGIIFNVFVVNIYYIMFVAYSLYYMLVSFVNIGDKLPWESCKDNSWSTDDCNANPYPDFSSMTLTSKTQTLRSMMDNICLEGIQIEKNISSISNTDFDLLRTEFATCEKIYSSPEEEYWNRFVLGVHGSDGLNNMGSVVARNAVILFVVWLIIFYCCVRGIRSIVKVAYVTVTFPTILLLILLLQGTSLEGHKEGIKFYTEPDWSKLSDMSIWSSAATQAMYSLGIVYGSHLTLASYNNFRHNLTRDVIIVTLTNTITSILCGFIVFSFLGHASYRLNKPFDKLLENPGPSLLFVSYIQGISKLQGSTIWSCLFFLMVLTLALDSAFIMAWTVYQAIIDVIPNVKKRWKVLSLTAICFLSFLLGFPLVTEGGIHMIVLLDHYTCNFSLTLFLLLESLSVCYLYGLTNFLGDVELMLGKRSKLMIWYCRITWGVTSPGFCVFIFIASAIGYSKSSYGGVDISTVGEIIGFLIMLTPFVIMISYMMFLVYKHEKPEKNLRSLLETIKELTLPTPDWGPRLEENKIGKYYPDVYSTPTETTETTTSQFDDISIQLELSPPEPHVNPYSTVTT